MYNAKYIIPGLVVFIVLFSSPFWTNKVFGDGTYVPPELALPKGEKECIENTDLMRAEHMQILNTWRDMAIRQGRACLCGNQRQKIRHQPAEYLYEMSLQQKGFL